jgi:hypothetical protein
VPGRAPGAGERPLGSAALRVRPILQPGLEPVPEEAARAEPGRGVGHPRGAATGTGLCWIHQGTLHPVGPPCALVRGPSASIRSSQRPAGVTGAHEISPCSGLEGGEEVPDFVVDFGRIGQLTRFWACSQSQWLTGKWAHTNCRNEWSRPRTESASASRLCIIPHVAGQQGLHTRTLSRPEFYSCHPSPSK